MKSYKIKPLTYGMASLKYRNPNYGQSWSKSCFLLSEKKDAVFWDIEGVVFCSYSEDEIPRLERVAKKSLAEQPYFKTVFIDVEEMVCFQDGKNYSHGRKGIQEMQEDASKGALVSRFVTDDPIFFKQ